jgi:HEXXH motif-containing protein
MNGHQVDGDADGLAALRRHQLSRAHFYALARGQGDADAIQSLWSTQRSRRMALLRYLLDEAERDPQRLMGPLPPAEAVWTVFERSNPSRERQDAILLHPQIGSWLTYCVRRLEGHATSDVPLWVHTGYLHVYALTIAAASGASYSGSVPLWYGRVVLPTLGSVDVGGDDPASVADAELGDRELRLWTSRNKAIVRLRDADCPQWWPLRSISVGSSMRLNIRLDDIDPFRDMADPVPPKRLTDVEFAHWHRLVEGAWEIICADDPDVAKAIAAGVRSIVPIPTAPGWGTRSASSGDAFGSVMVSMPPDETTMAVSIVHEFQHIKLGGLMHLCVLHARDTPNHYAPWREDPRPLGGFFQGIYAFLGIAAFWRARRKALSDVERSAADFEYLYARRQTEEALHVLTNSADLTDAGRAVVEGMVARVREWHDDAVGADAARLASLVADSHRAGWRIRHLRPDPATIEGLVRNWLASTADKVVIGASSVVADRSQRWSQGRLGLARRMILTPESTQSIADLADLDWASGVTQPDIDLIRGSSEAAQAGYVEQLAANPIDPDAWTGLGLALASRKVAAAQMVLRHPEVVRTTYLEATRHATHPIMPVRLVEWIDETLYGTPVW